MRAAPVIAQSLVDLEPMERLAADVFHHAGKRYLSMIDRKTTYRFFEELSRETTEEIAEGMTRWFSQFGYPQIIRVDNAPSFRSSFKQFCEKNNITLENSSPYNSESNSFAESAVKNTKIMVKK